MKCFFLSRTARFISTIVLLIGTTPAGSGTVTATAGAATFSTSQAGVINNGSIVIVGGTQYSVSAFNGTTLATLSGSPTFGASAFTYHVATFSTSQADIILTVYSIIIVAGVQYTVLAFNGTTTATLSGAPVFGATAFSRAAFHTTTINAYISATQVTLGASAGLTVTGAYTFIATDDTAAFKAAILALPVIGGGEILAVGRFLITSHLSAEVNVRPNVIFKGQNGFSWRGNNAPGPNPSTLCIKTLTTYLITKSGTTNEALQFRDIYIDMSNGGGTINGSTTCPGVFASNGQASTYVSAFNCGASDTLYPHNTNIGSNNVGRALWDLDLVVWGEFAYCYFGYCQNGRCFFTDNAAAQFECHRTEITAFREGYYHRNSGAVLYNNVVIEACTVGGASYRTNITHKHPWWEFAGIAGNISYSTGLAPRNHGLSYGAGVLDGNVNCYISALGGSTRIEDAQIQGFGPVATIQAWFECLGTPNSPVSGGYFTLIGKKATADRLFATTMAYGTTQRDVNMQVEVQDNWGADQGSIGQGLFMADATAASYVDIGWGRIAMNDNSMQFMRILRGRLIADAQQSGYSNTPAAAAYPKTRGWLIGDQIFFLPGSGIGPNQAGGVEGVLCTNAGTTTPTWRLFGFVHTIGIDKGNADSTIGLFTDIDTIMYQTPLTVARTITLPAPASLPVNTSGSGLKYRVVRTAAATGAFNLNINRSDATLLKALATASTWAEVEYSLLVNNWILTASGAL